MTKIVNPGLETCFATKDKVDRVHIFENQK